jgi:hypothetical protein
VNDRIRETCFVLCAQMVDKLAAGPLPCGTSSAHLDETCSIRGCRPTFEFTCAGLARSEALKGSLTTQPG